MVYFDLSYILQIDNFTYNIAILPSSSSTHDPVQRQVMKLFSQDVMKFSRNRHASLVTRTAAPGRAWQGQGLAGASPESADV